ncbi:mucin-2 [Drosophila novamexicana]|uniref:mucin-2 n=1 Tax=Drosophila novamexicana TaxID=47314 RepID=UPI0011E5FA74|nr:mucin-2 [Drosophila novamexicana]
MTTTTTTTRTTQTRTMTAKRGKFSTASSVLLLCAALLMTKSCGILALSGDGNAQLPGQADAWSETTTVSEGSGWEVTIGSTDQPEELTTEPIEELDTTTFGADIPTETTAPTNAATTLNPNEPEQETTVAPNEEQSTTGPGEEQSTTAGPGEEQSSSSPREQPSTSGPGEEQSSSSPSEQPSTSSPGGEGQSTTSGPGEEQSSSSPSEEPPTTTPSEELPTTTTEAEPVITTIAPTPPAPPVFECPTVGLFPDISGDCQHFHNCLLNLLTGELKSYDMVCPPLLAFSPTYGRCVRDLAECDNDAFVCQRPGHFAGSDETHYYNCVPKLRGGFHKYIVRCSVGQRFEPLIGRCWRFDWTQLLPGQALEASDLAAIKREQKELKAEEKLRLKAEKNQEKLARKQQKLEEKLAKKAAKEQAKKDAKANKPLSVESAESPEQPSFEF